MNDPLGRLDGTTMSEEQKFKLNVRDWVTKYQNDPLYPECPSEKDWKSENILESIKKWKKSLYRKEDLHWFHHTDLEPLDLKNPRIKARCHLCLDHVISALELFF